MNINKKQAAFGIFFLLLFLPLFYLPGCTGQNSDSGTTPSSTSETLAVSATPTTVAADGSEISLITATLTGPTLSDNTDQRTVSFTTSLGTLSASEAIFSSNGLATVNLSSSTAGVATVYASIGTTTVSTSVTFGLGSITISGTGNVADNDPSVTETTTITFTVKDINEDLASGVTLTLATPTTNHDSVTASFSTSAPSTNSSGVATAVLTTNSSDLGVAVTVTFTASASSMGTSTGQVIFDDM